MNVIFTLILLVIAGTLIFRSLSNSQQEAAVKNTKRVQKSVKKSLDLNKDGVLNTKDVVVAGNKVAAVAKTAEKTVKTAVKRGRKPKKPTNPDATEK